ncbi:MAG: bifunctional demethylmenaquinone methyltransferase/2-methoxy-6-polyprenyl-1,4-benzoquinol methylase UbiE, partial [Armatimonadetes bacterium]|nr:bifunctional demethylmenaquinone methyltransferase/2-methoxy-6-polyprenyl-1,4-benzoquinol methylase UbiE [Armatimonadota bacterium]
MGEPGTGMIPPDARRRWVRDAFHTIADRYDLLNHILSGGVHVLWKRAAVRAAALRPGDVALDACCGTGDMVIGMARVVGRGGRAVGVDFAPGMLAGAARRLARSGLASTVSLICADAEALPVRDGTLHAATFAFGLRNVPRPPQALAEVYRALRPGGRLVVLEFGRPRSRWLRAVYDLYSRTVIPRLGGWLSGRRDAYQYLHDSIRQWADPESLADLIRQAAFTDVRYRLLTGGIAVLHVAVKPGAPAVVQFAVGTVTLEGVSPSPRCVVPSRDPQTGGEDPGFQRHFARQREATMPAWAPRARFDHFYRLCVNTQAARSEAGKALRVGDDVRILGHPMGSLIDR